MQPDGSLGITPDVWYDAKGNKGNGEWVATFESAPCVVRHIRKNTEEEARKVLNAFLAGEPVDPPSTTSNNEIVQRIAEQMAKAARKATEEVTDARSD